MSGETGVTVVTTLVYSFYFACEAAGASCARHSLRPLISQGQHFRPNLARNPRRDREVVSANTWLFEKLNLAVLPSLLCMFTNSLIESPLEDSMRDNSYDRTIEWNYLQKWRVLIPRYAAVEG